MRIGILTLYHGDYGSFFQAVSLYKYLENLGHYCELINPYERGGNALPYFLASMAKRFLPRKLKKWYGKRNYPFNSFLAIQNGLQDVNVSPVYHNINKTSLRYDCIIVGSDELWSSTNPYVKYFPAYFGEGMLCPHFSYATSGINLKSPSPELKTKMCRGLSNFTHLSTRDEYTQKWVYEYTGRLAKIVVDPTLLNPFFKDISKEDFAVPEKGYLLVYGEHFSSLQVASILQLAERHNWDIYSVSWRHGWCKYFDVYSPMELQHKFMLADYCITSTFHGTAFSIIHHKPFFCFSSDFRGVKMTNLLRLAGLEDRLFDPETPESERFVFMEQDIDFSAVNSRLEPYRRESEAYILSALETCMKGDSPDDSL